MSDNPTISNDARDDIVMQRDTSDLIIELVSVMTQGGDYSTTINRILEMLSSAIHADRLYILEQQRRLDSRAFEWCAEGVPPRIAAIKTVGDSDLSLFVNHFTGCGIIYADTLDKLGLKDPRSIAFFEHLGIKSILIVPLRENGRFVGALGADNYSFDEGIDVKRLLETISPSLATVISNQQLFEELEWAGSHDMLTGLLNRRGIESETSRVVDDMLDSTFALALIDIDDFKVKNDLYGHSAGDEALRKLADAMRQSFPAGTILGRNGGDEFFAMLTADHVQEADELFKNFTELGLTFEGNGQPVELTTSIGYTTYPSPANSLIAAFNQADTALYAVKLAGKANALRYSDDLGLQYRSQFGFTPRDLAENVPGAIMVHRIKPDCEILFANDELVELLECDDLADFMEYTGMDYRSFIHPDDLDRVHADSAHQRGSYDVGAKFYVDYRAITKTGAIKNVAVNGNVVEGPDGEKVLYILVIDSDEHSFRHMR